MGFWAWFWIWAGVFMVSLVTFALLGYNLFEKASGVVRQAANLAPVAEKLQSAIDVKPEIQRPKSNAFDDPKIHVQARKRLLQAKAKKRQDRQRRLIKQLNQFDPTESRFQ
ncbi:MAG: hypothetical protein RLY88_173 [Actinomycetota bacterium]|jgi:hypothetical protein